MKDFSQEEQEGIGLVIRKFETMLRLKEAYYFEQDELEDIIAFYISENLHQKALNAIRFASGQYPGSSIFVLRKSQLLAASGKYQESLDLLNDLESYEPGNPEIHLTRGEIYSMMGNPAASIKSYKDALKIDKSFEDAYLFIAYEFQNQHKYGYAARYLRRCLQINPENDTALFEMSFCFDITGKQTAAIDFFKKFIDNHPYSKIAWFILGHFYSKQNDFQQAVEALDYAIVIDESYAAAWLNKANCLMALGEFQEAIACYAETIKLEEPDAYTFLYIGECYENLENHDKALHYYQKALELDDSLADAWAGIGVLADYSGKSNEAFTFLKKAINLEPDRSSFWLLLSDFQTRASEIEAAIESLQKVTEIEPDAEEGWISLTNLLIDIGRLEEARQVLSSSLVFHDGNPRILYQLCEVLLRSGKQNQALLVCSQALEQNYKMHEKMLEELNSFAMNYEIRKLIELYRPS